MRTPGAGATVTLEGRIASTPATKYRPYRSKPARAANAATWVQFDLGTAAAIEAIRLYPAFDLGDEKNKSYGFPARVRIEGSNEAGFQNAEALLDHPEQELPDPGDRMMYLALRGPAKYRYLRITATELRRSGEAGFALVLSKVEVLSGGSDVAEGRPAAADEQYGNPSDLKQLTRKKRPQGEGIVNNFPENVIPESQWRAAVYKAQTPRTGVTVQDGLFKETLENNIGYLLSSFSVDEMLRPFWERAGQAGAAGSAQAATRSGMSIWPAPMPAAS